DQGLRKISGVGGDAVLAGCQHGVLPADALQRSAARAGMAFVAGPGGRAEILTARPLENITAEARHVADLCACRKRQCLLQQGQILADAGMVFGLAHAHQRPESESVAPQLYLAISPSESVDIDEE